MVRGMIQIFHPSRTNGMFHVQREVGVERKVSERHMSSLRYVDIIWFIFHALQLLWTRLTQQSSRCMTKCMMQHLQQLDWKSDLPWFNYSSSEVYGCRFLNWIHQSSQLCSLLSVESLSICEDVVQHLLNVYLYDVDSSILTKPHSNQI
jgi:hypothetical protein